MQGSRYVVAGGKPWNRRVFDEVIAHYPGEWHFVGREEELTPEWLETMNPRYIFFLHWSHKVPVEIVERYECVCFHMSDVPYGRGGSPLQNLIALGHRHTVMTALRMVEDLDAGPVYMKRELCLEGGAEEVYIRATRLSAEMIRTLIETRPAPRPQASEVTVFRRRKPSESLIPAMGSLTELHDFLRMLDAEGYPRAFLEHEGFRYEFTRAVLYDGRIAADVTIRPIGGGSE